MSAHNMADYDELCETFEWDDIYAEADWRAPEELNVAHEICDRHPPRRTALEYAGASGERETLTFGGLAERSNRFANVLDELVDRGDRVFSYMPRIPEHYVALVGTLKAGAVFGGINERFGPEGIAYRLDDCDAKVVVTTAGNRGTVAAALEDAPSVERVIVVGDDSRDGDLDFHGSLSGASPEFETVRTAGEDDALLYYTSGTTGRAKGVLHKYRWVAGVAATQRFAADLREDDLYWSTGDLGWLTGPINTL
ncbi:MAG: AMP-binding protein, partial [Halalkalicoccus sp.]